MGNLPPWEGWQGDRGGTADSSRAGVRTFLIADVRGYSSYTERHGDEAAADLAARFAGLLAPVIEQHEGQVLELRGDEALAMFWSARQAIRAAIRLQARVSMAITEGEFPLPVGVGLDAGEAVAVLGGFRGAALNMAARLCSLARGGEVLATPEVVHLATQVEGARFVPYGPVHLKGFRSPVAVVRIEAADAPLALSGQNEPAHGGADRTVGKATRPRRLFLLAAAMVASATVVTGVALVVADDGAVHGRASPAAGRPTSSLASGAQRPELEARVVYPPDFNAAESTVYMMPDTATGPPHLSRDSASIPPITVPNSRPYLRFHESHGGVPFLSQTVRLVLDTPSERPILVTRVQPFVVHRQAALRGWMFLPEVGGRGAVRFLEASLDCPFRSATLREYDNRTGKLVHQTRQLDLTVSAQDPEQVELTVRTAASFIRWGVEVTYIPPGGPARTTRIGEPTMKVTGVRLGAIRTYTYYPHDSRDSRGRSGLVRTPQFDATAPEIAELARASQSLCH